MLLHVYFAAQVRCCTFEVPGRGFCTYMFLSSYLPVTLTILRGYYVWLNHTSRPTPPKRPATPNV